MGDVQVAYKRYVVQGMTHPSLSIVEKDNAVSISFVIIYRHTSSPLRYEGEDLRTGDFVTYLIRHAGASLRARELRQFFFFFFRTTS